jgi:SAM-dependent methyltransferase
MKDQRVYWDKVAYEKSFTLPFDFSKFNEFVKKDASILDVGCGYGRVLHELDENGYTKLTGIDFSEKMIQRGKQLYPDLNLMPGVGEALPFPEASFDAVILFAVITGNYRSEDQIRLIQNIGEVLKPGGIIIVNDFLLNDDQRNLERYAYFQKRYGLYGIFELPDGGVVRHHTREWIKELLQGFTQLQYTETEFTTMNGNISKGFVYLGRQDKDTCLGT